MNLSALSIKRPIFIICIVSFMLVIGLMSMLRMPVDQFPDVTFPTIFVQTTYNGASPEDMEKLVSKKIEDEMSSISGLDKLYSTNADGVSYVTLSFKLGADIKDLENQIRQRMQNIRGKLPDDIKEPIIRRFDPADQAIAQVAVSSSELAPAELYDLVDLQLKNQFETVPGVGQVVILGGQKREIQVLVNKKKLDDANLSMVQVMDRISKTSKDVPVGVLKDPKREVAVKASGEFQNIDSIRKVNVNFLGSDRAVDLDTIADIREGLEEQTTKYTLQTRAQNFEKNPAISMNIYKQSGSNTVKIVDLVKSRLEKVNKLLAEKKINATVSMTRETSWGIRNNINDVSESILIGIALCIIVVFFFLGSGKSTFITAMALPNSLLGGFIIMAFAGFTINVLTLLALSLAVGLLIDDAIVVRENIFRHIEMGKSPKEASLEGTKEVSLAVIATTLVVISVFGPISFLDGIVGQFFKQFGLTVVFTMLISLFDAFTVAPMLSTYLATKADHVKGNGPVGRMLKAFDRFQNGLENVYERAVGWVIVNRAKTIMACAGIFVSSIFIASRLPGNFLPPADNGEFQVSVELPLGTALPRTAEFAEKVEKVVIENPAIQLITTTVGYSTRPEPNKATIYVKLVPRKERNGKTTDIKTQVREALAGLQKEALIQIGDIDISGGNQKVLQLIIRGEDLDQLSNYVEKLKPEVAKIVGLSDVDTNYRVGKPEYQISFDRKRTEDLGVSTAIAGAELRYRIAGDVPAVYRVHGNEYDIRVRLREEDRDLRANFATTKVPNTNFNMIPLNRIATAEEQSSYSQINRLNKGRYILIDGNLGPGGNLGNITKDIERLTKEDPQFKMPDGITAEFLGQAEDFKDLMKNMVLAMGLGVLLIYFVLSSLYESFITPFSILVALPLAMTGAFAALYVTGKSIDLFSMIGIVMLLGVVAKNSILLVDYTHHLMKEGMERNKALIKACRTRLRPILMTSFALIGGTIPIAIGLNEASAQRTSMGVAIIGGLISSTFLTLLAVPAIFGYVDDFGQWVTRKFKKATGADKVDLTNGTHDHGAEPQMSK
jgi:hydrophobic/amphiphilic exporter-1 (mainly G- bacteria), HAE1 family